MSKHTPGPWQVMPEEVHRDYMRVRGTVGGCRYKVANVLTLVYPGSLDTEAVETRANAHLIAAAPDLLQAAREAERVMTSASNEHGVSGDYGARLADLRTAIAKAEGR